MKFSCERCQTRYSIGDEKVKGKVLKIRCKTCGNIIVVREQIPTVQGEASGFAVPQQREAALAAAGGGASSAAVPSSPPSSATNPSLSLSQSSGALRVPDPSSQPQMPATPQRAAAAGEHDWYVAIKGKQHGPAKGADIVRLFRDGKITERTYLWHDQLPAWTRLKDLTEFAAVVAEGPAPKRPPPPPPSEDGAELINFEQARAQRQGQAQQQAQPQGLGPVTNDPFAAIQGAPGVGGDNAPRESTRVFIMQAGLHNRAKKQKLYAGIAVAGFLGFVLLCVVDYQLDILGLKHVVNAVAVTTGIKEQPIEPGAEWGDGEGDPRLKCQLMPDPEKCVKEANARIAKRKKKPSGSGAAVSDADLNGAFGGAGGAGSGNVVRNTTLDENGMIAVGPTLSSDEINKKLGGGKGGPTGPKARIETPAVSGGSIDVENAMKVVRDGQAAIQTCVDDAMKRNEDLPAGKQRMNLSINTKGLVERASFADAVVNASPLGSCITKAAKRWKFAPPSEAADVDFPLVLR